MFGWVQRKGPQKACLLSAQTRSTPRNPRQGCWTGSGQTLSKKYLESVTEGGHSDSSPAGSLHTILSVFFVMTCNASCAI
mmetsp:Transcript_20891/g.37290  ORF Transcript_20891/g.37290 Transcript_20891/m.37290 type:complete len:80 (-) Transcript_20891:64-303(-)